MPKSGKPGAMRGPRDTKKGYMYCSLCPFHHKNEEVMLSHLQKKHKMDKRLVQAERRGRL